MRKMNRLSTTFAAATLTTATLTTAALAAFGLSACSAKADDDRKAIPSQPLGTSEPAGTGQNTGEATGNLDPCTVFQAVDFERVWGIKLKPTTEKGPEQKNSNYTVRSCKFEQVEDSGGFTEAFQFVVETSTFDTAANAEARFNENKSTLELSPNKDKVASPEQIADGAYFNVASIGAESTTNSYLVVRKGNQLIAMSATRLAGITQDDNRDKLIILASRRL